MNRFETVATLRAHAARFEWHTAGSDTLRDLLAVLAAMIWGAVLVRWALMLIGV